MPRIAPVLAQRSTLRAAVLLPAGVFAVHQLRFLLAFGPASSDELARQGHAYLTAAAPALATLLLLALAGFAARVARGRASLGAPRLARLWVVTSALLVCAYSLQETLEGVLASGHPAGFAGVFGGSGWISTPLSVAIGLAIALALRGAASVAELGAHWERLEGPRPGGPVVARLVAPVPACFKGATRLASARGPPAHSV